MHNGSHNVAICLCAFFLSCSSNKFNTAILSQIDSSILQANSMVINSNKDIVESIKLRVSDVRTQYRAERWLPVALHTDSVARSLLRYIDDLKKTMKENHSSESVEYFFEQQNRGHALFQKLLHFKTKVVAIDSASENRDWPALFNLSEDSVTNAEAFIKQFRSVSRIEAQAFLSSLQSHILRAEQQYLFYCLNATAGMVYEYEVFEAIVGQNAQILQAGNELKITAGLGSFSKYNMPEITIAGKVIPLDEKGYVVHKMKTPKRLGSYSVPVKVQFIDQDGKPQEREFNIEYQVVDTVVRKR